MPTNLLDALLEGPAPISHTCGIKKLLREVPKTSDVQAALEKALTETGEDGKYKWSAPALVKLLKDKENFIISATTIQRHRNGSCSCSQTKD